VVTSPLGVLAVRRADGRPPWAFPAGGDPAPESPSDAAVREVREETGCEVRSAASWGSRVHPATGAAAAAAREVAEARWLTLVEVLSLPDPHECARAARALLALKRGCIPDDGLQRTPHANLAPLDVRQIGLA
jgi:8-oxo-dGTP pyrophosphatase MutT (NUDIX family)